MNKLRFLFCGVSFAIIFIASSCSNGEDKMFEIARKHIEDTAFKNNMSVDFIELKSIDCVAVDELHLDSVRREMQIRQAENCNDRLQSVVAQMKSVKDEMGRKLRAIRVYSGIMDDLAQNEKEEMEELREEMERLHAEMIKYRTEMDKFVSNDSLISDRMKTKESMSLPKDYFRYRFYIKAVAKDIKTEETQNVMDTLTFYFDNDLKIIDLNLLE